MGKQINQMCIAMVNESLRDNESNDTIENGLIMFFKKMNKMSISMESYMQDLDLNIDFILALINKSIDMNNKTVNETELRNRAKLMYKYVVKDYFQHYLRLLISIVNMCHTKQLAVSKIDTIIEILQRENVITSFVGSHWFCANADGPSTDVIENRCIAIKQCLSFLSIMEMDDYDTM